MQTMETKDCGKAEFLEVFEVIPERSDTYTRCESIRSVFPDAPTDPTSAQLLGLIEQSGSLDFWTSDEEDVYSRDDGQAL